jgi:hypothetical protein
MTFRSNGTVGKIGGTSRSNRLAQIDDEIINI